MATKRGEKEVPTQDGWREPTESLRVCYAELPDFRPQTRKRVREDNQADFYKRLKTMNLEGKGNHGKVYTKDDSYVILWGC